MKILTNLFFLIGLASVAFSQNMDTLTPESKARWRIKEIKGKLNSETISERYSQAVSAVADLAATRIPYINQKEFRQGKGDTANVLYINEGLRSGIFIYDPHNLTGRDDSSMVLVVGKRRFVRENLGFVRPEWFGAIPGDKIDDAHAVQKALNSATDKGIFLQFSEGIYLIGNTVKPKRVGNGAQFKVALRGKGKGVTILKGTATLKNKNMFEFVLSPVPGARLNSDVSIRDIDFQSVHADRLIYANYITNFDLQDCSFIGGDTCGVQIGDKVAENYSVYVNRCYFNGVVSNNGHNLANLRLYARYPVVNQMVCDGGQYGIDLFADRAFIESCLLEGNKRAGIYMKTSGGGSHKIIGNDIIMYGGFEANAIYNGTMTGIYIESVAGGAANSMIANNWIYMPAIPDKVILASSITGNFVPSHSLWNIKGNKSKATAKLLGFNPEERRMVLSMVQGDFREGEIISQDSKTGKAVIRALVPSTTYAIQLLGSAGYNIISGNQIRGSAFVAMNVKSPGNMIQGNFVEAANGILLENDVKVMNNTIYAPSGYAVKRTAGTAMVSGNDFSGEVNNIPDTYLKGSNGNSEVLRLTPGNNLILQNGGKFVDNGARLQVNGSTSLNGNVNLMSLPVFEDNAAATKAQLSNGTIYRTATGVLKVKY